MAEPAWKTPRGESEEPVLELPDDEEDVVIMLQRWVECPDGRFELLEMPLTPEVFLDPQLEDKMTQGELHFDVMADLKELLSRHFRPQLDVKVLADVKHVFAKGFGPAPDISVIRGVRDPLRKRRSFHIREEGVVPCLVIEVVSPFDARIRRTDEVDKVALYQRHGVPEYVMVYPPGQATGPRFQLKGYRLDAAGGYRAIEPDAQGRLLSETTELRFGISQEGDRIQIFNSRTGERLRSPTEEVEAERAARLAAEERAALETEARRAERAAREAAESKARQEAEARKTAEAELKRLRSELERLKAPGA